MTGESEDKKGDVRGYERDRTELVSVPQGHGARHDEAEDVDGDGGEAEGALSPADEGEDVDALLGFLRTERGFDFTGYKRATLLRRIRRRMQAVGVADFAAYVRYLKAQRQEFLELFNTILINVTTFFRDTSAWQFLKEKGIPFALAHKGPDEPIRAWSAGCASGQEALSLAIVLAEILGPERFRRTVKIYATDIDDEALAYARQATYTKKEAEGLPEEIIDKYFDRNRGRVVFNRDMRRCIIFGRHDLIQDAPISRVDILLCRNTLMYFNADTQKRVLTRLHFALNPGGILFLGRAEMLLTHGQLFTPIDLKRRLFTGVQRNNARERLLAMAQTPNEVVAEAALALRLREASFDIAPIPQLVIDGVGTLTHANERARTIFGIPPHDLGRPFQDLDVSYKPADLRTAIDQARNDRRFVSTNDIEWTAKDGAAMVFDVNVSPLFDRMKLIGFQISFVDVSESHRMRGEVRALNQELESAYEELQSTSEELETTNEELQSTIEELETTNEELQSTNEELETMNEELQSTNEELQTTNDEVQRRGNELNQVNDFLTSVLTQMTAGMAVLNTDLQVQVWNRKCEELWGLRSSEVNGQHFLGLDIGLPVEKLKPSLRTCLATGGAAQEIVIDARNRRGQEVVCKVTCSGLFDNVGVLSGLIVWIDDVTHERALADR